MAVRSSMAALIARERLLINDPAGGSQQFADQDIQDILDESRMDLRNVPLRPSPTYSGSTYSYFDYYADLSNWEDDVVLKQYLTIPVTPLVAENIVGHWQFAATTLPPVYLSGKTYDVWRAAADLLERQSARFVLAFNFSSDGQSFQRGQAMTNYQALISSYRLKQRPRAISVSRADIAAEGGNGVTLKAKEIDYFSSGQ